MGSCKEEEHCRRVKKNMHRSRIFSASHCSSLLHSVHGNAPTVILSTFRMLASILLTWIQLNLKISPTDRIIVFCHDLHRAFIQSLKIQRLIIYINHLRSSFKRILNSLVTSGNPVSRYTVRYKPDCTGLCSYGLLSTSRNYSNQSSILRYSSSNQDDGHTSLHR